MTPAPQATQPATKDDLSIAKLKGENRSLRRENKWHREEVDRLQARVAELEAQLQAVYKRRGGRMRANTEPTKANRPTHFIAGDRIDWSVFYLLGNGTKILQEQEKHKDWDFLAVDWSGPRVPDRLRKATKFWDRPLHLDWSDEGVPKITYPTARLRARKDSGSQKVKILWAERTSPKAKPEEPVLNSPLGKQASLEVNFGDEPDELACDWSGHWLPRCDGTSGPFRRLPGPYGRRRGPRNAMGRCRNLDQARCHLKSPAAPPTASPGTPKGASPKNKMEMAISPWAFPALPPSPKRMPVVHKIRNRCANVCTNKPRAPICQPRGAIGCH